MTTAMQESLKRISTQVQEIGKEIGADDLCAIDLASFGCQLEGYGKILTHYYTIMSSTN
jgi:hypothetical protein